MVIEVNLLSNLLSTSHVNGSIVTHIIYLMMNNSNSLREVHAGKDLR